MNLADSFKVLWALFGPSQQHGRGATRHPGSKRPRASEALLRERRKREGRARRRRRLFA